jgi:TonB family protein
LTLCAALLAHAVVLALLLRGTLDRLPVAGDGPAIQLVMAPPPPPALAALAQVLPVSSAMVPAPLAKTPMVVLVPRAVPPITLRGRAWAARTASAATPVVARPAPQPAPATQAVSMPRPGPDPAALAGLNAAIDQAVRAAAVMPAAARRQHREGRAQVAFMYVDGTVSAVALLRSSQSMVLDAAALHAVQGAKYPLPPASLRGHKLSLSLWVNFLMAAEG